MILISVLLKRGLLLFFFATASILAQSQQLNLTVSYEWKSDSSILLNSRGTNFKAPFLVNLKIADQNKQAETSIFQKDSILFKKGIFQSKEEIDLQNFLADTAAINLELIYTAVVSGEEVSRNSIRIKRPEEKIPVLFVQDTALYFQHFNDKEYRVQISISDSSKKEDIEHSFLLKSDSLLLNAQLIQEDATSKKKLLVRIFNEEQKEVVKKKVFYDLGRFYEREHSNPLKQILEEKEDVPPIALSGSFYVENNAFSSTPQHANGLQYPSTIFRAQNTVSIYGVPFQLNATHTTNQNIDPNFRNFFSFSLDVSSYRNQVINELNTEELSKEYPLGQINKDLNDNRASIERLEQMRDVAKNYPASSLDIDSLLNEEQKRLQASELMDSLSFDTSMLQVEQPNLDQINVDQEQLDYENPTLSTTEIPEGLQDSLNYDSSKYQNNLERIDHYIERYEASNRYKEQLKNYKIENPNLPSREALTYDQNELFQQFKGKGIPGLLLRFEKLDIGNFYEFAGKYSISDVEMKGINTEFLIDPDNSIGLLRGKVNNFQSFNLDDIEENIHVSSFAIKNKRFSYFSPSLRVTQFKDKSISPENPTVSQSYYVTSLVANGEVSSFLYYEGEVNRSNDAFEKTLASQEQLVQDMAFYGKVEVTPFDFVSVNVKYDRIGSNFKSDGVYFLTRNLQSYSVGSHWKLFKNKIYFKNDYTFINRHFEQDELRNESKKFFFDLGSRFKRIPNFQIIHSPITVDIANNLDTNFSNLDAFSSVTIARIFHVKKIKKTIYNSALIYSEILNDFFEGTNKQRGFQHFMGISNEEIQFSFTSSYSEIFEKVRFVSTSVSYQLNDQVLGTLQAAKNFQQDQYSELLRLRFDVQLKKYLLTGVGGAMLFERGENPNIGSTAAVKLIY